MRRLSEGWEHYRGNLGGVWEAWRGKAASDNVTWEKVAMPHCFNTFDAVDPDRAYYQGPGWYRTRRRRIFRRRRESSPSDNRRSLLKQFPARNRHSFGVACLTISALHRPPRILRRPCEGHPATPFQWINPAPATSHRRAFSVKVSFNGFAGFLTEPSTTGGKSNLARIIR